jgi:hypothetical protein
MGQRRSGARVGLTATGSARLLRLPWFPRLVAGSNPSNLTNPGNLGNLRNDRLLSSPYVVATGSLRT